MFHHVDTVSTTRTGFHIRQLIIILCALCAVVSITLYVSYTALAGQNDDADSESIAENAAEESSIEIVEEINLGDQGIFPIDHTLATIHVDGETYTVDTDTLSEADLQEAYGFELTNEDYTEEVSNEYGYDIYVNRKTVETVTEEVQVPYTSSRVEDENMEAGTEKITTYGEYGVQVDTYEVVTLNGETTTNLISSEITVEPVNEVRTYGTKEIVEETASSNTSSTSSSTSKSTSTSSTGSTSSASTSKSTGYTNSGSSLNRTSETISSVDSTNKTFTTTGGTTYSYSQALSCTAYSYCIPGGTTASGTTVHEGCVAVDPSVIPLGSTLYIICDDGSVVYGYATAEDTGGSIKGNKVDLYYDSQSKCINFGVRAVTVYILN